jgi:hypothetical protein
MILARPETAVGLRISTVPVVSPGRRKIGFVTCLLPLVLDMMIAEFTKSAAGQGQLRIALPGAVEV